MAPYDKQPRPRTTFEHTIQVEAQPTEFFLLASVPYQDVGKLARATHAEIELGYCKTNSSNSCRQFVRAKIQEGMVTDLLSPVRMRRQNRPLRSWYGSWTPPGDVSPRPIAGILGSRSRS